MAYELFYIIDIKELVDDIYNSIVAKAKDINLDATYCLSNIFEKDFTTISFKMQPMFVNFAIDYRF